MKVKIRNIELEVQGDEWFWEVVNEWEPHTFNIIDKFVSSDTLFFDVGAWNGVVSLYASRLAYEVIAIEPDKKAYNKLYKNILANHGDGNVMCYNMAVGKEEGVKSLYHINKGDSMSSLVERKQYAVTEEKAKVVLLSSLIKHEILHKEVPPQNIFVKMDIEGGEVDVLEEMRELINSENRPNMYVSFHPFWFPAHEKNISDIIEILGDNYRVLNAHQQELTLKEFRENFSAGEESFVFLRK